MLRAMDQGAEANGRAEPGVSRALAVLPLAILAISSAAVLVRQIEDASPVAIAFWRTAAVGLLVSPALRRVSRSDAAWIGLAGAILGVHFVAWFSSLGQTTVLRSTVLVCASPIFAALYEALGGGGRVRGGARFFTGTAVAIAGIALLAGSGGGDGTALDPVRARTSTGDALALFAAAAMGAYLVIGRRVRQTVGVGTYASGVCLSAAIALGIVAALTQTPLFGFAAPSWALIAALALGPQLLGHNGFNYALRHLRASTVGAIILLEPIVASLLAGIFLREWPGPLGAAGAAVAIAGVGIATLDLLRDPQ